jgi:glycosyltransferase involved in cell wall biosynthesis
VPSTLKLGIISTVGGGYSWAGSEEMWRFLAETALVKGHAVRVNLAASMAKATLLQPLRENGLQIVARSELNGVARRLARCSLFSRFNGFAKGRDDLICLSMGALADCVWIPDLLRCYWRSSVPWVVLVQGNGEHIIGGEDQREILRCFYAKAKTVIFVSRQNLELAERQLAWRFNNAVVMPNPIRERLDEPLAWPQLEDGIWRLAEVARFEVLQKRQDQLLEALAAPEWKARPFKLTFYGSGPDERHLRALVKHYGLEQNVVFGGYVRDFRDIWRANHLHILPTAYEGLPLSLIESMFCGRPAVVTRAGGNAELITDGQEGFVSPGMHPEIIRETLERAWQARDQWAGMGRAAQTKAARVVPSDWADHMLKIMLKAAGK